MDNDRQRALEQFSRLLDIMDELREKCPWDRKQTLDSLRPQTIEETYELCEAVLKEDYPNICKELGDVLLHVVFYSKIGTEQKRFGIADVCEQICNKLVYRHPHVFGTVEADSAEQVVRNWEQLKTTEKGGNRTVLAGVPEAMPSLLKAYRMQDKAAAMGFDWQKKEDVWAKVREEIAEFEQELEGFDSADSGQKSRAEAELGDLVFSLVNASRLYRINPDTALERTNAKFRKRFTYVEEEGRRRGMELRDMTLGQMDGLWEEAKSKGL